MRQPPDVGTRIHAMLPHARIVIAKGIDPAGLDNLNAHDAAAARRNLRSRPDAVLGAMLRHVSKTLPFRKDLGTYVDDVFVLGVAVGLLFDRAALAAGWRPR